MRNYKGWYSLDKETRDELCGISPEFQELRDHGAWLDKEQTFKEYGEVNSIIFRKYDKIPCEMMGKLKTIMDRGVMITIFYGGVGHFDILFAIPYHI